jgi:hypothetical protein
MTKDLHHCMPPNRDAEWGFAPNPESRTEVYAIPGMPTEYIKQLMPNVSRVYCHRKKALSVLFWRHFD